ncbi:PEP-CTERM sorting domain-containing protein [Nostoc sp. LPT]|uniref:PEP-CTERM sorting domain-containing protein n=1 Tax=Nostoc sp. LPT TaxID=2815387 RepID=UPI001DE33CD2|nr:PEP-CTERM sorting domain-containing protein [Nostoc sp. LPT]MBN4003812.1 PEP-CTERM sorting domain-containing protein [Nostoc sp. LPT]
MAYQLKKTLAVATIIAVFNILSQGSAGAVSFNFTQGGWSQGGIVTGSFSGEDLDGNRIISKTEITDFSLAWSGNEAVPRLDFKDVDTWQFSTEQVRLISGFTSEATTFWSANGKTGSVSIGAFVRTISDTTESAPVFELVSVQPVPEPSTIVGSLVVLCAMLIKKRF